MNLDTVMTEVGAALRTISGLRVYEWGVSTIEPPAAAVLLPERVLYNTTYARGYDRLEGLQVIVAVGQASTRKATKMISAFAAGSGAQSVVAALQGYAYTNGTTLTVVSCEFPKVDWGGKPLLAASFKITVDGKGA